MCFMTRETCSTLRFYVRYVNFIAKIQDSQNVIPDVQT